MTRARGVVAFLLFISMAAVPMYGQTATTDFRVLLDVDNNAATGCTVATMPGVEQVLTTRVVTDPTTANVTRTYRQVCTGGALGAEVDLNTPPWPVGFQPASGNVLVETRLPFDALSSGLTQNMRIGVSASGASANHTAIFRPDGSMIHFPMAARGKRRSVTAPGSERVFILDGNDPDWHGLTAIIDGIAAGGSQGLRLIKFFAFASTHDDHYYFRFDANLSADAPFANDDAYSRPEGEGLSVPAPGVLANDGDPNGNPLTAQPVSPPSNGSVTLNPDGSFTYTPNDPSSTQTDQFQYRASNGAKTSNTANVRISVTTVASNAPVGVDDAYGTAEDELLNVPAPGVLANDSDPDGDALTATLLTPPTNGAVVLAANGGFTYTPNDNFFGTDTFVYNVSDGTDTVSATVTITVTSENDPPSVATETFSIEENSANGSIVGTVTAFDSDAADTHTFSIEGGNTNDAFQIDPSTGTITVANAAAVNFESQNQWFLLVRATDNGVPSRFGEATITINVVNMNDAPVANDTSATTNEDTAVGITLTATDEDANTLTWNVSNPSNGVLSGTAPNLTYTPNANFFGTDSFTFSVNDGTANSNTATVNITVVAVNDVPVAVADAYPVNEGATLNEAAPGVLANDTDVESSLTAVLDAGPTNASAFTLNADGSFDYTHDGSETTSDSFTYHANDGTVNSSTVTVTITVTPLNDIPVANDFSATTNEDTPVAVTLSATDGEGSTLTYNVNNPSNGSLSGTAPNLTYTPNADFFGTDTFTYTVNDGTANSNTATVTITVNAVNDVPVAVADNYSVDEGGTLSDNVLTNDTDVDSALTAVLETGPTNASAFTLNADGSFTYTHDGSETTSDSFTYHANDGIVDSNTVTVSISINPINDAPVANGDSVTTNEDTPVGITLVATDAEGSTLTYNVNNPSAGVLTGTAPNLTYTPNADFFGTDSFTYSVNDGTTSSNTATITITVISVNDVPVAADDTYSADEGGTLNEAAPGVLSNDSDVESSITATLVSGPSNASAFTLNADGSFTYTHDGSETTSDSFTYTAHDGTVASNTATVTITINPVNDPPVNAVPAAQATNEDTALTFNSGNGNQLSISDGDAGTNQVRVTLSVTNGTLTLGSTTNLTFGTGDGTADAGMTFDGAITDINNALDGLTYDPTPDFNGAAVLTITTDDLGNSGGAAETDTDTVNITVNSINDAPVATDDAYTVAEGGTLNEAAPGVLANDTDLEDSLTAVLVTAPSNDSAFTLNADGSFSYTHDGSETTTDSFSYRADDGSAQSTPVTVAITITAVNDAPVAVADAASVDEGGTLNGTTVLANDTDAEGDTLNAVLDSGPSNATSFTLNADGTYTYTHDGGESTSDSFTYHANDTAADSNPVFVTITINGVNDAPTASAGGAVSVDEDDSTSPTDLGFAIADVDAGADPVQVTLNATNGTMTIGTFGLTFTTGDGSNDATMVFTGTIADINSRLDTLSFQGFGNFTGAAGVSLTVDDLGNNGSGGALTANASVSITVDPVNDTPSLTAPSSINVTEDTAFAFSAGSMVISDVDVGSGTMELTFAPQVDPMGTFSFGTSSGITFFDGGYRLQGNISDLNAALATMSYTPPPDHASNFTIDVRIDDLGNTGSGGEPTFFDRTINVVMAAANDAPVVTVPGAQVVNEDTPLVINAGVTDVDAGSGTAELQMGCGSCGITLASTAGLNITTGDGTDDASIVATGTIANINAAIDGFTFQGVPNFVGLDTITIVVSDLGNTGSGGTQSDTETIQVTVMDVNDAPVNAMPAADETTDEDVNVTISPAISISDVDAGAGTMAVTLTSTNGTMTIADTTGLTVTSVDAEAESTISFTGTIAAINNALTTLSFNPTADFSGTGTITILTDDQGNTGGGSMTDSDSMNIVVSPVNDAPSFTVGPDIVADSNAGAHTSDPWATGISEGPNESSQNVTFEITANDNTGLFTDGPDVSPTGVLTFTPVAGVTGVANVQVRITDDGGTAAGGVDASASQSFTISLDDAPFVSSTTPAESGVVATDSTVSVTFSEDVTLSGTHFQIVCGTSGTHDTTNSNVTGGSQTYTFDPNANFTQGESCTLTIFAAQVADNDTIDGPNNMVANHVVNFTVDAQPSVTTIVPADSATDIATDTNIDITFSEPVTVSAASFTLSCASSGSVTVALTGSGASYTLNPDGNLPADDTCTVTVLAAQVADQDGIDPPDNLAADFVSIFQTDVPPFVSSTTPADNATDPQPNTDITITFSEPVDATGTSFTINCTSSGSHTFVLGGNPTTYTLNPNTDFTAGETCTVTVLAANVDDQDANDPPANMTADYVFDFSFDKAPEVSSTTPSNGATGVTLDANVDITFDEDVTLTGSWFTIDCATSGPHTAAVTGGPSAYTLNPDSDFVQNELCTVTVLAAQVTDNDANDPPDNMLADYVFSFTTDAAPSVSSTTPADNATDVGADTDITITFSELVDVTAAWLDITCTVSGVHGYTTGETPPGTFVVNPGTGFTEGETCTVTVLAAEVSDDDSFDPPQNMLADYVFDFTIDEAPEVTTVTPVDDATNIATNASVTIVFSESVTFSGTSSTISCGTSGPHTFAVSGATNTWTLNPDSDFAQNELCTVTIVAGDVADSDTNDPPNGLSADYVFDFTTDLEPSVTATTPSNGDTTFPSTDVTITFSEAVDVTGTWFDISCTLSGAHTAVVSGGATTYTLNPGTDFTGGESCTVTVFAAQVDDQDAGDPPANLASDHSFTFSVDAAPEVTTTTPADNDADIEGDADITINFSEAVNVTASAFTINCNNSGGHTYTTGASPSNSFVLNPNSDFTSGETCTVTVVAAEVTDDDGFDPPDNLAADYVFDFTIDVAPAVFSTTPADNATDISAGANVDITFTESVTVAGTSFTINCDVSGVHAFGLSGSGASYTLDPGTDFTAGETCTVTVLAAGVADSDANDPPDNMLANHVFDFTIDFAPSVSSTTPADNDTDITSTTNITLNFSESVTLGGSPVTISCTVSAAHTYVVAPLSGDTTFTINPDSDFTQGETCTVTVLAAQVADDDGNDPPDNMLADYVFDFTIDAAPFVSSTDPADNATNGAPAQDITITFSEPVDVTGTWFDINCTTTNAHTAVVSGGPTIWTLNPDSDFAGGETCTVQIFAANVTDDDGNDPPDNMTADYTFDFIIDEPPTVDSTSPVNGAINVATNTAITITYSEAVHATGTAYTVSCGAFTLSNNDTAVHTLTPTTAWTQGATCNVGITAAQINDMDPNDPPDLMVADYNFSFTTDAQPTVVSTTPADNATGVTTTADVVIQFSEPVNINTNTITIDCSISFGHAYTITANPATTFTLNPSVDFTQGEICTVTVPATDVADDDSNDPPNSLAANYVFDFTIDAQPSVIDVTPDDNATGITSDASVVIQFSEPVNINMNTITVVGATSGAHTYAITANPATTFTLNPDNDFTPGEVVTVTVPAAEVADDDSNDPPNNLAANYVFDFTIDQQPSVTTTSPVDETIDIAKTTNVTITFSENVDTSAATFTIKCPSTGTAIGFAFVGASTNTNTVTLNPDTDLPDGERCEVTVIANQVNDTDLNDPPANLAANFTFQFGVEPNADPDTHPHTHVGNINSNSDGFLTVVTNDDFPVAFPITSMTFDATTANGGQIVMNTTVGDPNFGEFTYNPPPGFEGTDTFNYTINTANGSDSAQVSIPVSGMVWFIDANDGVAPFDGRIGSPFQTLAQFEASALPGAGDNVFVYQSGTAYAGPITLDNNMRLIGQDSATAAFGAGSITGLTPAASQAAAPGVNSGDGVFVNITSGSNGVVLGQNNQVRGLRFGANNGFAITGNNFGTLFMRDALVSNSNGGGFNLATGTMDVQLSSFGTTNGTHGLSLNGVGGSFSAPGAATINTPTTAGISITGGNPSVSHGGTITTSGRPALLTSNMTGGSITLGTVNVSGTGAGNDAVTLDGTGSDVDLTISSATINTNNMDDGLVLSDLASGSAVLLSAGSITTTGATRRVLEVTGNVNCTCNLSAITLNASSSDGILLPSTHAGTWQFGDADVNTPNGGIGVQVIGNGNAADGDSTVSFRSIDVATCSQAGIYVHSHSGSFAVNGTGAANSGGTISNCADWGARFGQSTSSNTGAKNITITDMFFNGNGTVNNDPAGTCGDGKSGTNTNCAANVDLQNVVTATLTRIRATGSVQMGINGRNVTDLLLDTVEVDNNGDEALEDGIQIHNLFTTVQRTWTGLNLHDNTGRQLEIQNASGTNDLIVNSSQFIGESNVAGFPSATTGAQGVLFAGNNVGTNVKITVNGATYTRNFSAAFSTDTAGGANVTAIVDGGSMNDNGQNFTAGGAGSGDITYTLKNMTLMYQTATGLGGHTAVTGIAVLKSLTHTGDMTGTITNNIIGNSSIARSGGPCAGCNGISVRNEQTSGTHNLEISNNTVQRSFGGGISIFTGNEFDTSTMNLKMYGNTVTGPDGTGNNAIIVVNGGGTPAPTNSNMCADIGGSAGALKNIVNNTSVGGSAGSWLASDALRVRSATGNVRMPNLTTFTNAGAAAHLAANNTLGAGLSTSAGGTGTWSGGASSCF